MELRVASELFHDFPGLTIGVIIACNIDNRLSLPAVEKLLNEQKKLFADVFDKELIAKHPHITVWREAYRKFNANPKDYYSSVENLAHKALEEKDFKQVNTLVDLYNYISLKYFMPIGGEDLDTLKGDLVLRYATDHETPVLLLGQQEARAPKKGEVIYADDNGAVCRRWNWKEAERTKLTEATHNAVFVIEGLSVVDRLLLVSATQELAALIKNYCGGEVSWELVNQECPVLTIKEGKTCSRLRSVEVDALIDPAYIYKREEITHEEQESSEHKLRVEKVKKLQSKGIDPWPATKEVTATTAQIVADYQKQEQPNYFAVAGRVMSIRTHGKAIFATIQDVQGSLQIYIKQDKVGSERFTFFTDMIDIGDMLWCSGMSFRTRTGEITLEVDQFELMAKCLFPLPEKFHGLTDIEKKYRQRYLDLIVNPETRERFKKRTIIIRELRKFLDDQGCMEVETSMLHPIPGGAAARPFVTHHNALNRDFYLRISPELYLKRLVVGGFERVYEINRNFRNEGVSTRHNPEFTMLELYIAYQDYHFIMSFVEELLRTLARKIVGTLQVPFGSHILDFEAPFARLTMEQALIKYAGLIERDLSPERIDDTLARHNTVPASSTASYGEKICALFEELAEDKLIQPTFIIDYPVEVSPLSKRDARNPAIAARFELFMATMEISNGFNELNDPFDQADRFRQQVAAHESGDEEAHRFDADYVRALEYGLPPTVGVGIGIDRLVMLLTNTTSIKEVILFPALKYKE